MEAREQEGNKGGFHCFHFTFMGEEDMAHSMFKMKCKFKFEIHFLCMVRCLETMEIQLEQSLLFESDEIVFSFLFAYQKSVKFICKFIPTMQLEAILNLLHFSLNTN